MSDHIKPTVGRVILFRSRDLELTGGPDEVPAIVTRVWTDTCINVQVLRDGHGATPIGVTSVMHSDLPALGWQASWRWMPYQKAVAAGDVEPLRHAS